MGNAQIIAAAVQDNEELRREAFAKINRIRKRLRDESNPFLCEAEDFRKLYR